MGRQVAANEAQGVQVEAVVQQAAIDVPVEWKCRTCRHPKGQFKVSYIDKHEAACQRIHRELEEKRARQNQRRLEAAAKSQAKTQRKQAKQARIGK